MGRMHGEGKGEEEEKEEETDEDEEGEEEAAADNEDEGDESKHPKGFEHQATEKSSLDAQIDQHGWLLHVGISQREHPYPEIQE